VGIHSGTLKKQSHFINSIQPLRGHQVMIQRIDISRTFSNNAQHVSSGFDDALTSQNIAFLSAVKSVMSSLSPSELADNASISRAQEQLPSLNTAITQINDKYHEMFFALSPQRLLGDNPNIKPYYTLIKGGKTVDADYQFNGGNIGGDRLRHHIMNISTHKKTSKNALQRIESGTGVTVKDIAKMAHLSEIVANARTYISDMQIVNSDTNEVMVAPLQLAPET
jgi:hypothetical protein